jgi:5-methylcytosine-specific restriction endonuclease McrA
MSKFQKGQQAHNSGMRNVAKLAGEVKYFTGVPCKFGHVEYRHVSNGACMECSRIKTTEFRNEETSDKRNKRLANGRIRAELWRKNNPNHENTKVVKKRWKKENVGLVMSATVKRRLSKINRTPNWLTVEDNWLIKEIYDLASLRSKVTKVAWHVDHIVPLQGKNVSGLHTPWNLQLLTAKENLKKRNSFDADAIARKGK